MLTDLYRKQWRETVAELDRAQPSSTPVDPTSFRSLGQAEPWTANPENDALIQQRDSAVTEAQEAKQNADGLSTKLADVTEEKRGLEREKSVLEREKVDLCEGLEEYRKQALEDRAKSDKLIEEREQEKKANELRVEDLKSKIADGYWRIDLFLRFAPPSCLDQVEHYVNLRLEPPPSSDSESDEDEGSDEDEDEVDNNLTYELEKQTTEVAGPQPEHQQDRGQEQVGESAAGAYAPAVGQTNTVTMGGTEEAELLGKEKQKKKRKKKSKERAGFEQKDHFMDFQV